MNKTLKALNEIRTYLKGEQLSITHQMTKEGYFVVFSLSGNLALNNDWKKSTKKIQTLLENNVPKGVARNEDGTEKMVDGVVVLQQAFSIDTKQSKNLEGSNGEYILEVKINGGFESDEIVTTVADGKKKQ
jgi:hypothetical protein